MKITKMSVRVVRAKCLCKFLANQAIFFLAVKRKNTQNLSGYKKFFLRKFPEVFSFFLRVNSFVQVFFQETK